jgi:hypothetical protein
MKKGWPREEQNADLNLLLYFVVAHLHLLSVPDCYTMIVDYRLTLPHLDGHA